MVQLIKNGCMFLEQGKPVAPRTASSGDTFLHAFALKETISVLDISTLSRYDMLGSFSGSDIEILAWVI
ncbi:hypothetical protein Holit_02019 [Hollandina sp. SP2]